jgi:hypothetical protein
MVHKVLLRKQEGVIVETDDGILLLTKEEYDKAKKRFKNKYSIPELKKYKG